MTCPRCNGPANEETLREFGGVCPKCLLQFSEEQDAPAFPNLEIVEMIGQGGMGVVYKARQKNLDRLVALKVLSPHLSEDPEFVERFTREAKALAQLNHPNIVAIYDSGIHDRVPYLVMEFVDGTPLRGVLGSGKLTPARALEVIPQICDALQYAHASGIVHRDIKPENILIDRQGRVKIADFGLAKLSADQSKITMSGYVLGTPRYMAPEQFEPAGRVDHRADIYSLGVVFYEMLTGEVPMGRFKPPSAKADVDQRLDPVVLKSLEPEPEDRYQSAGEVKEEVAGLDRKPAANPPPAAPTTHPLRQAAGVLTAIGAMAVSVTLPGVSTGTHIFPSFFMPVGIAVLVAAGVIWLLSHSFVPAKEGAGMALRTFPIGCLILLVAGAAILLLLAFFFMAGSVPVPTPPMVPVPDPALDPEERQAANVRGGKTVVPEFKIDDVWPAATDLPAGLEGSKFFEGAEALKKSGLPEAILPDLASLRGLVFQHGKAIMVGLEFKTEFSRRRWQREEVWKKEMEYWHYTMYGNGQAMLLLRHDRSAAGTAAEEILEGLVEKRYGIKYPTQKKPPR